MLCPFAFLSKRGEEALAVTGSKEGTKCAGENCREFGRDWLG